MTDRPAGPGGAIVGRAGAARYWCTATAAVLLLSLHGAATVDAQTTACEAPADALRVVGAVEAPVTLTGADIAALERVTVEAPDHHGTMARWEGPTLRAILDRAGVPGGAALHGRPLSAYVVVEARDGYRATFALAELDGGYWRTLPLLADRRDGQRLAEGAGPYRVVVPDAPKHGRWVRQVACLRVAYPD